MSDLNVAALAASLEKTAAHLKHHIATEATKRAAELGKTYAKAADERIRDNVSDMQRLQDLVAELQRQLNVTARHSAAYFALGKALRQAGVMPEQRDETVPVSALLDCIEAGFQADRVEFERQRQVKVDASGGGSPI